MQLHEVRCGVAYSRQESYHCRKGAYGASDPSSGQFSGTLDGQWKGVENELCHKLRRLLGIEKLRTTFYTQQCIGGIERWHSTMNSLQAKTVEVHQMDWPQRLACVVAAHNATVHESTRYSPNFLIFGGELAVPVDVVLGNPPVDRHSLNDYADHLVTSLYEAYCDARSTSVVRPREQNVTTTASPIHSLLSLGT